MGECPKGDQLTGAARAAALVCVVLACGWVGRTDDRQPSGGTAPVVRWDSQPKPRVIPVHVIPADLEFEQRHLALNHMALEDVRQWYARILGGATFQYDPIVVQRSRHTLAELSADDFQAWWPLLTEEFRDYGFPWNERSDFKLLMLVQGAGGWAGADSENGGIESVAAGGETDNGEYGGVVLVGDSSASGISRGVCPVDGIEGGTVWWCNWNTYRGTIAHELGHTWGVPHPAAFLPGRPDGTSRRWECGSDGNTVMQCHWNFPNDSLLAYEARHMRSLRFFQFGSGQHYLLLSELAPVGMSGHVELHRLGVASVSPARTAWIDGRGGGTAYPWAVVVGEGSVLWRLDAGCWVLVAEVGRARGSGGYGSAQVLVSGEKRKSLMLGGDPPVELRTRVCGPGRLELRSTGELRFMTTFGNARIYREP